jgi:hypothetical protein
MNLAYILLQPPKPFGLVLMTNVGGPKANDALMALAGALYENFGR